jgi:hypothetical protein
MSQGSTLKSSSIRVNGNGVIAVRVAARYFETSLLLVAIIPSHHFLDSRDARPTQRIQSSYDPEPAGSDLRCHVDGSPASSLTVRRVSLRLYP